MSFIVNVINYDVVGALGLFACPARVLKKAQSHKLHAIGCGKIAVRPIPVLELSAIVVYDALVVLNLRLDPGYERFAFLFILANQEHKVQVVFYQV